MYARMVIGEASSETQVNEFARIYRDEVVTTIKSEPGFHSESLLTEDGGNMAVCLTMWKTRDACLRYHSSRSYRQFITKTQHLLLGNFVVKLFKTTDEPQTIKTEITSVPDLIAACDGVVRAWSPGDETPMYAAAGRLADAVNAMREANELVKGELWPTTPSL